MIPAMAKPEGVTPEKPRTHPHEEIPMDAVYVNPEFNSRSGDLDIQGLSESIDTLGLMQPIVVARDERTVDKRVYKYRLVDGFRRFAAVTKLGWKTIPAVIIQADVENARLHNLAENLARKDLRLYDTMRTIYDLSDKRGIQTVRIARETGMKESRAASMIKVWPKLAPSLKERWVTIPNPSWEPTMHQLTQWSSLSPPEQNKEWSKWANDESVEGDEFEDEEIELPPRRPCHKRRKTSSIRSMIQALSDDKTETSKAQIRALLWALGERDSL